MPGFAVWRVAATTCGEGLATRLTIIIVLYTHILGCVMVYADIFGCVKVVDFPGMLRGLHILWIMRKWSSSVPVFCDGI